MRCSTPNTKTREAVDNSFDKKRHLLYDVYMDKLSESVREERTTTRDKRTITLGVRVSPEERDAIERAAAREYRCIGDYVRYVVLKTLQCSGDA